MGNNDELLTEKEKKLIEETLKRIKEAEGNKDKIEEAFIDFESELPPGKIRSFIQKTGKRIDLVEEINESCGLDEIDNLIGVIEIVKNGLKDGLEIGIPQEIIDQYEHVLNTILSYCNFVRMKINFTGLK
ncbi:MAG: hypothetical protein HYW70_01840 [Candidatus Nealsonbacteria bacterium]|nr:hypothetical protein [Candidatus Nealsonbacteria bacterium]